MSESCQCELAGWCERHKITKTPHFRHLCETNARYRKAWDEGRGPGQETKELTQKQLETKARIEEARARTDRLIGWLTFFRLPDEHGVGDTASRLLKLTKPRYPKPLPETPARFDARELISRLLSRCSCSRSDAVARLNKDHPYDVET